MDEHEHEEEEEEEYDDDDEERHYACLGSFSFLFSDVGGLEAYIHM
jgi:hypothetical protein